MDATGLSAAAALERLRSDGPNVVSLARPTPAWRRLVAQLVNFFAVTLWVASALAVVAGLPQLAIAIAGVVLFNGVFAFVQEYRAEHAAERIRDLLPANTTVVRDGTRRTIPAAELVRDDLVVLDAGDRVSADLLVVRSHGLRIDTSTLTGESEAVAVGDGEQLFAGTFVVEGEGQALVEATGGATRLAGIAQLTRTTSRPQTPLTIELHRVVRTITVIAVAVGVLFLLISIPIGASLSQAFTFAIGVTVALVPEALLPTVTLSLAVGAQRMAQRNALVRRLDSVETLGSTTFICTDKTGTLTQNRMAVIEVWTPDGSATIDGQGYDPDGVVTYSADPARAAVERAAIDARLCSNGRAVDEEGTWVAHGDPMEAAIDALVKRLGADARLDGIDEPSHRFPFDPRRRRMSVVVNGLVVVKGAPDTVLQHCLEPGAAWDALSAMTDRGLRVIAVAERPYGNAGPPTSAEAAETELVLTGLLALEDPPRSHVAADIAACRDAGIRVAMVTGDHPMTARAIADQISLLGPDDLVVTGDELPADDRDLGELIDHDGIVLARISPEQKLRIAHVLRLRGHVVAMTGDGVNDGPALQEADIGIAMGRTGTDVAREAADLVLLDDDFSTIVEAIRHGRATFLNVRRFLTYHLTDNVAELMPFVVWALSAGRFPLAIGVLQVLALDIGTDTLPAVALGAEPPARTVLARPPIRGRLFDGLVARRAFGILGPAESMLSLGAFAVTLIASGWRPGRPLPGTAVLATASGCAFSVIVIGQLANAFACRSTSKPVWRLGARRNGLLVAAVLIELTLATSFVFVPVIARALGHRAPSATGFMFVAAAPPVMWLVDAADKRIRRRNPS